MTIKEKILTYILSTGDASFANLKHEFPEEFTGEIAWEYAPNVMLWWNMTEEFAFDMKELRDDKLIVLFQCGVFIYAVDGICVTMRTVGKHIPAKGYKKPRWMPALFKLTEAGKVAAQNLTAADSVLK